MSGLASSPPIRVLCVGTGTMGTSHARAYHEMEGFEIVGIVSRGEEGRSRLAAELGVVATFGDFASALDATRPDAVSISTYPDTHASFTLAALRSGAHVFVEKPLAVTIPDAEAVVRLARETGRKVVVGYILRHQPSWAKFVELARGLGKPLVMRMNLNQQSHGPTWHAHRMLMNSVSPIVDCGVHYLDVMCQMTRARPVRVHAIGARLSDEIAPTMYNYGHLQVVFADGSIGWYEAGWGPMISEEAFFVKDVVGPRGAVSIVGVDKTASGSDEIDAHTRTNRLRIHHAALAPGGGFARPDELVDMTDEPGHQELCKREQAFFLSAIRGEVDLTDHLEDAVQSLRVALAADESVRTGRMVDL
jgi:predicted dehydrogenase